MNDIAIMWIPCKPSEADWTTIIDITCEDYVDRKGEPTGYLGILADEYEKLGYHLAWMVYNLENYQNDHKHPIRVEIISYEEYCVRWGEPQIFTIGNASWYYAKQN